MFGELTKLFDRNFAIGYFLPAAVFISASALLFWMFSPFDSQGLQEFASTAQGRLSNNPNNPLGTLGSAAVITWLLGVSLLAANKRIIRFRGGYGWWNQPWNPFLRWQRFRFRTKTKRVADLQAEIQRCEERGKEIPAKARKTLKSQTCDLANHFPEEEPRVLPSAFGNTLLAFERYPSVMYGLGAISGWNRLLGMIPKDYRAVVDAAKAQVDLLVNFWFLSYLFLVEYLGLVWIEGVDRIEFLVLALLSARVASYWARQAAVDWGDTIKTSFDLYLPELRERLGLARPDSRQLQREQWKDFSRAIVYRDPDSLPQLAGLAAARKTGEERLAAAAEPRVDSDQEPPPVQTH